MKLDLNTARYLELFDTALLSATDELQAMEWLDDVQRCDASALKLHFVEQGIPYPDFPEATDAVKRAILSNAELLHGRRYTIRGFEKFVQYFEPIGVTISIVYPVKQTLWLGVATVGLPNAEMLATVVDADEPDACFYLFGPQVCEIVVTMNASVSAAMKLYFQTVLPLELPFGGDDDSVHITFVFA